MATAEALLTPRFDGGNFGQISWQLVSGKGLDIHLDQADKRAAEVRFHLAASIDNYANGRDDAAMRTHMGAPNQPAAAWPYPQFALDK